MKQIPGDRSSLKDTWGGSGSVMVWGDTSADSSGACPYIVRSACRHLGAIMSHIMIRNWKSLRFEIFTFDFQCDFESSSQWVNDFGFH